MFQQKKREEELEITWMFATQAFEQLGCKVNEEDIVTAPAKAAERVRTAAVMKSRNSEERAKEVANISKQQDAGRARSAKAILAKAMQK